MPVPEIHLSPPRLYFISSRFGESLSQILTVQNLTPEDPLQISWEVAPHPHDPPPIPHSHSWIEIHPHSITADQLGYCVKVHTRELRADSLYHRHLILKANNAVTHRVSLNLKTAPLPRLPVLNPVYLASLFMTVLVASGFATWLKVQDGVRSLEEAWVTIVLFLVCMAVFVLVYGGVPQNWRGSNSLPPYPIPGNPLFALLLIFAGLMAAVIEFNAMVRVFQRQNYRWLETGVALLLLIVGTGLGINLGLSIGMQLILPPLLIATAGLSIVLMLLLTYLPCQRKRQIRRYHRSETHLIQP